jgi:hypothetical protein
MDDNLTRVVSVFCMQDAYAEPDNDTRNLAGFMLAVAVQDVQDMPPVFTKAPPVTVLNNTLQKVSVLLLDSCLTQNCASLCYYAASSGNFLSTLRDNLLGSIFKGQILDP